MAEADIETISLIVKTQDGKKLHFRVGRGTNLKKVLIAFCQRRSLDYPSTKFLIHGSRFNHNKSPNDLKLEDSAEIEAMVEQLGGSSSL